MTYQDFMKATDPAKMLEAFQGQLGTIAGGLGEFGSPLAQFSPKAIFNIGDFFNPMQGFKLSDFFDPNIQS